MTVYTHSITGLENDHIFMRAMPIAHSHELASKSDPLDLTKPTSYFSINRENHHIFTVHLYCYTMVVVAADFKDWLKGTTGMRLNTNVAVKRIIAEGFTSFESFLDCDTVSIQALPTVCRQTIPAILADEDNGIEASPLVRAANISTISVQRLIVAHKAVKYYSSINRIINIISMNYERVLNNFKEDYAAYEEMKKQDEPTVPLINDKDHDRKIIKWVPVFTDCIDRTFGAQGPLSYVIRSNPRVPNPAVDPLVSTEGVVTSYFGSSGSLLAELEKRLPHEGTIYKTDNASVYMMIEKATRDTSVASTVKAFSRTKNGRDAYLALIANHAGDEKYRAITKKSINFLQNTKWTGCQNPLENHVSLYHSAHNDLTDCNNHITVNVPDVSQKVEYLIDSITCSDSALQASIRLVRANTNNMRSDFEKSASTLIEVDPYRHGNKSTEAKISAIVFNAIQYN